MIRYQALIVLIYLVFVGGSLNTHSLFVDEFYTLETIQLDWSEIVNARAAQGHPPLFFLIEKIWCNLFGTSEFALRLPALFFGLVSVLLFFHLARKFLSLRTSVLCAIFLISMPNHLQVCQIARSYTLAESLLLATYCIWVYFPNPQLRHRLALFFLAAAATLTHMSALVHINTFAAAAIICVPQRWRQIFPLLAGNIPFLFLAFLFAELQDVPQHVHFAGAPGVLDICYFPVRVLISNLSGFLHFWLLLGLALGLLALLMKDMYRKQGQPLFSGVLWITWFAAVFAVFLDIGVIRIPRYFVIDACLIILVMATSFPTAANYMADRKLGMSIAGIVSLSLFALFLQYSPFPQWRHIAGVVQANSTPETCVVMASPGLLGNPARHYLKEGFVEPANDSPIDCQNFKRVIICGNERKEVERVALRLEASFRSIQEIPFYRGHIKILQREE